MTPKLNPSADHVAGLSDAPRPDQVGVSDPLRAAPVLPQTPGHRRADRHRLVPASEPLDVPADAGLTLFINTAEPGSRSEQALNLLASWTATPDREMDATERA